MLAFVSFAVLMGCKGAKSKQEPVRVSPTKERIAESRPERAKTGAHTQAVLRQVLVKQEDSGQEWQLPHEQMALTLGSEIVQTGAMVASAIEVPPGRSAKRAEIHLSARSLVTPATAETQGSVTVALESVVHWIDGSDAIAPRAAVMIEVPLPSEIPEEVNAILEDLSLRIILKLAESIAAQESLRTAEDEAIVAVLADSSGDASLIGWAMQLVAERKLASAIDPLIAYLGSEDTNLAFQTIPALVAIGDPRAVAALVNHVHFDNYEQLSVAMEAISAIGGQDAIEFLEFVASGHQDKELRDRAQASIQRILDRDKP